MTDVAIPTLEEALAMDPVQRLQEIQAIRLKVINGEDVSVDALRRALVLVEAHTEAALKASGRRSTAAKKTKKEQKREEAEKLLKDLFG